MIYSFNYSYCWIIFYISEVYRSKFDFTQFIPCDLKKLSMFASSSRGLGRSLRHAACCSMLLPQDVNCCRCFDVATLAFGAKCDSTPSSRGQQQLPRRTGWSATCPTWCRKRRRTLHHLYWSCSAFHCRLHFPITWLLNNCLPCATFTLLIYIRLPLFSLDITLGIFRTVQSLPISAWSILKHSEGSDLFRVYWCWSITFWSSAKDLFMTRQERQDALRRTSACL